jgi:hypothetical protein
MNRAGANMPPDRPVPMVMEVASILPKARSSMARSGSGFLMASSQRQP